MARIRRPGRFRRGRVSRRRSVVGRRLLALRGALRAGVREPLELPAPKNGANVHAADLDGDGSDEVIVRYDMQDGEDFRRQLRVESP